jgi:hypothetical protein
MKNGFPAPNKELAIYQNNYLTRKAHTSSNPSPSSAESAANSFGTRELSQRGLREVRLHCNARLTHGEVRPFKSRSAQPHRGLPRRAGEVTGQGLRGEKLKAFLTELGIEKTASGIVTFTIPALG